MDKVKFLLFFVVFTYANTNILSQTNNNQNCFISILDFGAKMDGVHDDSKAIMSSLDQLDYAFIPAGKQGARIEQTIVLKGNQSLYGISRASRIVSYVPTGQFAIRAQFVHFVESVLIKDLTIDVQTKDSNGIQAYETRNVYIDNIAVLGNRKCNIGVQFNGGSENGSAWNQMYRYTITRCTLGLELTSNTKNYWCNRNYIGHGVIQSCQTGVRLYRTDTNTILSCPQDCPVGIVLEKSRLNTINTFIENSKTHSILLDDKSNFNTISGQFVIDTYKDSGKSNLINLNRPKNTPN